jgi:hypothetical protein
MHLDIGQARVPMDTSRSEFAMPANDIVDSMDNEFAAIIV